MQENAKKIIYKNKRSKTLYFASLISLWILVFTYWMIFKDFEEFKQEFSSTLSAYLWTAFFLIISKILIIIMIWLSGKYVLKIELLNETHEIRIKTWSILGLHKSKTYYKEILSNSLYNDGYTNIYNTPMVNAPWISLKTENNKTLVVDIQAEFDIKIFNAPVKKRKHT